MIEILTDDVELLKEACSSLAYALCVREHPNCYSVRDEWVSEILKCEGLKVVYDEEEF